MGGDPNPIRLHGRPETGAPGIAAILPHPTAGQPCLVGRRCGNVGTGFDGRRRLGQVCHLVRLGIGPVPGSPLKALRGLAPITGHPLAARRQIAPDAADPKEILPLVVPAPVAGDPRDVGPLQSLFRRQFFDGSRRRFRRHDARLGIVCHGFRECLVNRPAREHLHPLLGTAGPRRRRGRLCE